MPPSEFRSNVNLSSTPSEFSPCRVPLDAPPSACTRRPTTSTSPCAWTARVFTCERRLASFPKLCHSGRIADAIRNPVRRKTRRTCGITAVLGPRVSLRSPGHESFRHAQPRRAKRTVGRHPPFTKSNSAVFFVPAPRWCAGVRPSCSHPSPKEGVAERRQAHSSVCVARARRDDRVSETRAVPLQPGRPLGAPSWRFSAGDPCCRLRQWHRSRPATCPRQVKCLAGGVPDLPRCGSRRNRGTPLPAPSSGSSPEDAPSERGCDLVL